MNIKKLILIVSTLFFILPQSSFAWGSKGHKLVADIAAHFLDDSTKQKVQSYLGSISFEEAGTWMDDNRSNSYYDFMKTWHYADIEKGQNYVPSADKNIITVLNAAIVQLQQHLAVKNKDIKTDLLLIFHLTGDIHQPLHCGYPGDKGGNDLNITSPDFSSNLHSAWDTQIIEDKNITMDDCLSYYNTYSADEIKSIQKINVLEWFSQSRALLDTVYCFKNNHLSREYIDSNAIIIKKQLLIAGLRLATVLTETLKNYPIKKN
jgi:hypothetical protein